MFKRLFEEKLQIYIDNETKYQEKKESVDEAQMFSYARHRLQEIEQQVTYMYNLERQFTQNRVTSLHNEAAAKNLPEVQRELLEGRYNIQLRMHVPFQQKIVQVAQEPVAFQLYKKRHFKSKIAEPDVKRSESPQGNLRRNLLKIANAKEIGDFGLKELVETATERLKPLEHRVLGLPKEKELQTYNIIKKKVELHQQRAQKKNAAPVAEEEP